MTTTATIDQLRPGSEYPGGNINARTYKHDEIEARKDSLIAFGQLQSLTVCPAPGKAGPPFYVAAGGLRRTAFEALVKEKRLPKDHPIEITVRPDLDSAMALAASIEENRERVPLHPVNEYEQFAELMNRGKTPEEIAALYGMKRKQVDGILALGRLHPEVRAAWREGRIKAETAQAFTLESDQKRQVAVFKKLAKENELWSRAVRDELIGEKGDAAGGYVNFIGIEAYEAAGGKVMRDLFGDQHGVSDFALAKRLADEKMAGEIQRLIAEGWAWASVAGDLPHQWTWNWNKIKAEGEPSPEQKKRLDEIGARLKVLDDLENNGEAENADYNESERLDAEREALQETIRGASFKPDQKKKSGVVLELESDGTLKLTYGVIRPKDIAEVPNKDLTSAGKKKKSAAKKGALSNSLAQRLSERLTIATANTLAKQPEVAIPAIIAGYAATYSDSPVNVSLAAMTVSSGKQPKAKRMGGGFQAVFAQMCKAGAAKQNIALAAIAADALSFKVFNASDKTVTGPSNKAILDALDPKALTAALIEAFDAEDYFNGVGGQLRVQAIREACGDDAADRAAKLKKAEQVTFAIKNVPGTGWLPPQLRTTHYKAPAKAKKKAG